MNTMNDAFNIFWLLLRKMCLSKYLEIFKQHIFQNQRQHSKLLKHRHWTEKKKYVFLVTKILKQILFMNNRFYPVHEKKHRQGIL